MTALRLSPSGPPIVGNNPGDTLIWNGTEWLPGPGGGGGGMLAGDADGPLLANTVGSLTGTGGGANVPLANMSSAPLENSVVIRGPAGGPYSTLPVSSLPAAPVVLSGDCDGPSGSNVVGSLTGTGGGANVPLANMSSAAGEPSFVVRGAAGGPYSTVPVSTLVPAVVLAGDCDGPAGANVVGSLTGTGGGANVPLANMSSDPLVNSVVIRGPAGGPYSTLPVTSLPAVPVVLAGDCVGPSGSNKVNALSTLLDPNVPIDSLIDDAVDFRILVRDPAGGGIRTAAQGELLTEFDHILRSRADLVAVIAPVAGVFVLPAGSYFIKSSFALAANEGMQVNGGNVLIQGGGAGKVVTGGSATLPVLDVVAGTCQLLTVGLNAAVANTIVFRCGGDVSFASQCVFTQPIATTNPCVLTTAAGRLTMVGCRVTSQAICFSHEAAGQRFTGTACRFESDLGNCIRHLSVNGWLQLSTSVVRVQLAGATGPVLLVNAATATLMVIDCEVAQLGTTQVCCQITSAGTVAVEGGEWQGSAATNGTGLNIAGNVTRGVTADNVEVLNMGLWVTYVSGTIGAARVSQCIGHTGVLTCVQWPVGNIPTRGLVELANSWSAATASVFTNHQQNDARVNRRSNHSSTAPMSETGIVP